MCYNESMEYILFVNACIRENSRTKRLADYALNQMQGVITELNLSEEEVLPLTKETLAKREELLEQKQYDDPMFRYARQFAQADTIVIAAPYWDLSFPAILKTYLENVTITGITFQYTEQGFPQGLCRAKKLIYITSAGGPILSTEISYGYIQKLCSLFYEIPDTRLIKAEGLDLVGADISAILQNTQKEIDRLVH